MGREDIPGGERPTDPQSEGLESKIMAIRKTVDVMGNVTFTTPSGRMFEWSPRDLKVLRYPANVLGSAGVVRDLGRASSEAEALEIVRADRRGVIGEVDVEYPDEPNVELCKPGI